MITLTDNAVKHLQTLLADKSPEEGDGLRVLVENGGCAGMQYAMKVDTSQGDDAVAERDGVRVYVDPESLKFIDGSEIDYEDSLASTGFRIHNPKAVRSCGCGTSFEASEGNDSAQQ